MTDLRNHEIVLGKMLGSLLPIGLLLAATIPLWMFLLLLGGVSVRQVFEGLLVVATAALAAGSLGGLVALWRERTFQSLALTVLCLVFYLGLVRVTGALALEARDLARVQQWLDPFQALASVQELRTGSSPGVAPAYGFAAVMLLFTLLLNGLGLWRLRVWNPSGEPVMQREKPAEVADERDEKDRSAAHAAPGRVPGKRESDSLA